MIAEQGDPPKSPVGREFELWCFGGDWVIAAFCRLENRSPCDMNEREDIHRRALAFAGSGDWCNPRIVSEKHAAPEIVRIKGSGNVDDYRLLRVEVDMRPEFQSRVTKLATQNDKSEL